MTGPNRYRCRSEETGQGWRVVISDPGGGEVFQRTFPGGDEAAAFASTVEQHLSWLSEEKFRRYYRLPEPGEPGGGS